MKSSGDARRVIAHINYHFFAQSETFIYFCLSNFRRFRPLANVYLRILGRPTLGYELTVIDVNGEVFNNALRKRKLPIVPGGFYCL